MIEELAGIEVDVDYASEFECRKSSFSPPLAIFISQSGETSDALGALHKAKLAGSRTLAICNVENSSMMRDAHSNLHIKAGPELSVPSTKAFGGQLTCLLLLALSLAQARHALRNDEIEYYAHELAAPPEKLESTLKLEKRCAEIAGKYFQTPDFTYVGRGPHHPGFRAWIGLGSQSRCGIRRPSDLRFGYGRGRRSKKSLWQAWKNIGNLHRQFSERL